MVEGLIVSYRSRLGESARCYTYTFTLVFGRKPSPSEKATATALENILPEGTDTGDRDRMHGRAFSFTLVLYGKSLPSRHHEA